MLPPDQEQCKMSAFVTFIQHCTWGSLHGIRQEKEIYIHTVKEEVKLYLFAEDMIFKHIENLKEPTKNIY